MTQAYRLSIAPMFNVTDRHMRFLLRLISRCCQLYTEMVVSNSLLYGDRKQILRRHWRENPVVLQLGGSQPAELAHCAKLVEEAGFDQINLNVGCPSKRVKLGNFGACLMVQPQLVADCVNAMQRASKLKVSVKTRVGIDNHDDYIFLQRFVDTVAETGCQHFIIHARKAWLKGLSAKQNRTIPPLCYDRVYRLKSERPELTIVINGGIETLDQVRHHLKYVDGTMIGRKVWHNPMLLAQADKQIYGCSKAVTTRAAVIEEYSNYVCVELNKGTDLRRMIRPLLGLYYSLPGASVWRKHLTQQAVSAGVEVFNQAFEKAQEVSSLGNYT